MTPDEWQAQADVLHERLMGALGSGVTLSEIGLIMNEIQRHEGRNPAVPAREVAGPETAAAYSRATRRLGRARTPEQIAVAIEQLKSVAFRTAAEEDAQRNGQSVRAIASGARGRSTRR